MASVRNGPRVCPSGKAANLVVSIAFKPTAAAISAVNINTPQDSYEAS
jgi:hypothetical protein